jgi:hypothetical protein
LVKHFWRRWSSEYLVTLQRLNKWQRPTRNFVDGDVLLLREGSLVPARWPIACVVKTYKGGDGLIRVVDLKTAAGTYKCPVNELVLLLPRARKRILAFLPLANSCGLPPLSGLTLLTRRMRYFHPMFKQAMLTSAFKPRSFNIATLNVVWPLPQCPWGGQHAGALLPQASSYVLCCERTSLIHSC